MAVTQLHEGETHVIVDRASRQLKARKIERLLERHVQLEGASILDVGTGAGYIAAALAARVGAEGRVCAVDVDDRRQVLDGYEFTAVGDTSLPFADASFDIVLSNHIFDHVLGEQAKLHHLQEIARVLRSQGVAYLAVTSRYVLVEPHFHLPFLSWLPAALRTPYIRAFRRGESYDCDLPSRGGVARLVRRAGLVYEDLTLEAVDELRRVEGGSASVRLAALVPDAALRVALPLIPTMIVLLRRGQPAA
jgi:SAM-dependent methyltransferase